MQFNEVKPDTRIICHSRGEATGTVLYTRAEGGFGTDRPVVCIDFDNGGEAWNHAEQLSPLAIEDDPRGGTPATPGLTREHRGYTFWRGGRKYYVRRFAGFGGWVVTLWDERSGDNIGYLALDKLTRKAAVAEAVEKIDSGAAAPVTVPRPEIRPDMVVVREGHGDGLDACGTVLTTDTPQDMAPGTVLVKWFTSTVPTWTPSDALAPRGDLPGAPGLLDVEQGSPSGEGVFWRRGQEYRVSSRYSDNTAPWRVAHRAADGTLTTIVDNQPSRESARSAGVLALYGFETLHLGTASYLVAAENKSGQSVRLTVPGADEWGRLGVETPEQGLRAVADCASGMRFDRLKNREVRNRIAQILIYPVRPDGSLGIPSCEAR
ncbi:hypothetical protein [Streptomyces xanthochromogenes]|uniref:Uncharacterized protein n=1 Tax=Streptomyces xanthochromogenes TaxID=67384 RepID=A0ABQ2ZZ33_9ACTN|nr:hypothetical protein [Streptomyces xanthochromogenes]GGY28057.1 hypothetical protein GCM10010326_22030 [Streptomyces xanthochromogenes]